MVIDMSEISDILNRRKSEGIRITIPRPNASLSTLASTAPHHLMTQLAVPRPRDYLDSFGLPERVPPGQRERQPV